MSSCEVWVSGGLNWSGAITGTEREMQETQAALEKQATSKVEKFGTGVDVTHKVDTSSRGRCTVGRMSSNGIKFRLEQSREIMIIRPPVLKCPWAFSSLGTWPSEKNTPSLSSSQHPLLSHSKQTLKGTETECYGGGGGQPCWHTHLKGETVETPKCEPILPCLKVRESELNQSC